MSAPGTTELKKDKTAGSTGQAQPLANGSTNSTPPPQLSAATAVTTQIQQAAAPATSVAPPVAPAAPPVPAADVSEQKTKAQDEAAKKASAQKKDVKKEDEKKEDVKKDEDHPEQKDITSEEKLERLFNNIAFFIKSMLEHTGLMKKTIDLTALDLKANFDAVRYSFIVLGNTFDHIVNKDETKEYSECFSDHQIFANVCKRHGFKSHVIFDKKLSEIGQYFCNIRILLADNGIDIVSRSQSYQQLIPSIKLAVREGFKLLTMFGAETKCQDSPYADFKSLEGLASECKKYNKPIHNVPGMRALAIEQCLKEIEENESKAMDGTVRVYANAMLYCMVGENVRRLLRDDTQDKKYSVGDKRKASEEKDIPPEIVYLRELREVRNPIAHFIINANSNPVEKVTELMGFKVSRLLAKWEQHKAAIMKLDNIVYDGSKKRKEDVKTSASSPSAGSAAASSFGSASTANIMSQMGMGQPHPPATRPRSFGRAQNIQRGTAPVPRPSHVEASAVSPSSSSSAASSGVSTNVSTTPNPSASRHATSASPSATPSWAKQQQSRQPNAKRT